MPITLSAISDSPGAEPLPRLSFCELLIYVAQSAPQMLFGKQRAVLFCHNGAVFKTIRAAEAVNLPGTARIAILALRGSEITEEPGARGAFFHEAALTLSKA
jgi:hypothetical protein